MADIGYVRGALGAFSGDQKSSLDTIFTYILSNLRFGLPDDTKRTENFQLYRRDATTPATANEEFSIAHGFANAPRVVFPVLDVTQTGNAFVPLMVARPADSKRIYLKSSSTSAPITVFLEAR
jgi:hypothetical protein